jgi:hypothetical protein
MNILHLNKINYLARHSTCMKMSLAGLNSRNTSAVCGKERRATKEECASTPYLLNHLVVSEKLAL